MHFRYFILLKSNFWRKNSRQSNDYHFDTGFVTYEFKSINYARLSEEMKKYRELCQTAMSEKIKALHNVVHTPQVSTFRSNAGKISPRMNTLTH